MCILGDFNEDILMGKETYCHTKLESMGFKQMVDKPTCDSGTFIDHVYVTNSMKIVMDVTENCYYSGHDYVLCMLDI